MNQMKFDTLNFYLIKLNNSIKRLHYTSKVFVTLKPTDKDGIAELIYNEKLHNSDVEINFVLGLVNKNLILIVYSSVPWLLEIIHTWLFDLQHHIVNSSFT
jgi:hypothetical protein